MKAIKYIPLLAAFLGMLLTSCDSVLQSPGLDVPEKAEKQFALNLQLMTRGEGEKQIAEECFVKNATLYIFDKTTRQYIETVTDIRFGGSDGDAERRMVGKLKADYDGVQGIDFILLVNTDGNRPVEITDSETIETLKEKLTFDYGDPQNWKIIPGDTSNKVYIPMTGIGNYPHELKPGINECEEIKLIRALARVEMTFKPADAAEITKVEMSCYNKQGRWWKPANVIAVIPDNVEKGYRAELFKPDESDNTHYRIYVPEYLNPAVTRANTEILQIIVTKDEDQYTMDFIDGNKEPRNITRNSIYRYTITGFSTADGDTKFDLKVEDWMNINIDVPPFTK